MTIISFSIFLMIFVAVGLAAATKRQNNRHDYYIASQSIPPWLVGLSAVATNNSGYMFIGVIGYTYATGLASIWLMLGWILGDLIASFVVHRKVREVSEETGETSYIGLLSHWNGANYVMFQRITAIISLILLLAYASAQLVAGAKALHVLFEWPIWGGAVMGAILVVAYCFAGGIRASIWTDAAQSIVMVVAMGWMLIAAVVSYGGIDSVINHMQQIDGFMNWLPKDLATPGILGGVIFAISWVFAGLSVAGQPHIMVRFMTLQKPKQMNKARLWYYSWFTIFYAMATAVGMLSRIYFPEVGSFDQELALPMMAQQVLPPVLVGLILAGIFAATLSTADSLVLSCSSTLTHDLLPQRIENIFLLKMATIVTTVLALAWALLSSQSVFSLVIFAWSGLASAFIPLLIILVFGGKPSQSLAIVMSLSGILTAFAWRYLEWHHIIYEGMPGILVGLIIYILGQILQKLLSNARR